MSHRRGRPTPRARHRTRHPREFPLQGVCARGEKAERGEREVTRGRGGKREEEDAVEGGLGARQATLITPGVYSNSSSTLE
eukprot:scaffold181874_cov40-Tisochrysis_lutea.AAC.4